MDEPPLAPASGGASDFPHPQTPRAITSTAAGCFSGCPRKGRFAGTRSLPVERHAGVDEVHVLLLGFEHLAVGHGLHGHRVENRSRCAVPLRHHAHVVETEDDAVREVVVDVTTDTHLLLGRAQVEVLIVALDAADGSHAAADADLELPEDTGELGMKAREGSNFGVRGVEHGGRDHRRRIGGRLERGTGGNVARIERVVETRAFTVEKGPADASGTDLEASSCGDALD